MATGTFKVFSRFHSSCYDFIVDLLTRLKNFWSFLLNSRPSVDIKISMGFIPISHARVNAVAILRSIFFMPNSRTFFAFTCYSTRSIFPFMKFAYVFDFAALRTSFFHYSLQQKSPCSAIRAQNKGKVILTQTHLLESSALNLVNYNMARGLS